MLTVPNCSDMGDDSRDGGTVSYRRRQCCRMGATARQVLVSRHAVATDVVQVAGLCDGNDGSG